MAQLNAGETVYQAGELPEIFRISKIHYAPPKTVCETPFASTFPPSMENGDGTRHLTRLGSGVSVLGLARFGSVFAASVLPTPATHAV